MFKPIKNLYTVKQTRELDSIAINKFKIPGFTLMQRAGEAAFEIMQQYWPCAKKIIVVCGKGNNAGDGYIVARLIKQRQIDVKILYLADPEKLTGDAKLAYQDALAADVQIEGFTKEKLDYADLIVDAIFGSGLQGDVVKKDREAIAAINNARAPKLAIDIPSGLNGDTGFPMGAAIEADLTVTFVAPKQGLFTGFAADHCGKILFNDLDLPNEVYAKIVPSTKILELESLAVTLKSRHRTAYKNEFGHLLVVGGDYGMAGAVRMAGEAAVRVGSGLTTVATRGEHIAAVSGQRPELMCYGINNAEDLDKLLTRATAIVIGPGLGQTPWGGNLWKKTIQSDLPKIVDADALTFLANKLIKKDNWILTPHPGEAARLLHCTTKEIQNDRFAAIRALQKKYGGICVLKGAGTLIIDNKQNIYVCEFGNPGMASGGMGDILSGVIGGLVAQGISLADAAKLGVVIHSKAGDYAAKQVGERGLLATDLLPFLQKIVNLRF
jgi:NAD(P)H-hydrate epimerase